MAQISLTFDNGPEPDVTPHVLDTLAAHKVKATFFVIGKKLDSDAGYACSRRAHEEGHWIGNHSYAHSVSLGEAPAAAFDEDILRTQEVMGSLAHPDKLFRPYCNSGVLDSRVFKRSDAARLEKEHFTCVLFNAIVRDWEDGEGWPETALREINARPWTTLVLHDIPRVGAMRHLDAFIKTVLDRGHTFEQDFSPDCVPVRRGNPLLPLEPYINESS